MNLRQRNKKKLKVCTVTLALTLGYDREKQLCQTRTHLKHLHRLEQRFPNCALRRPGIFQNIIFSYDLCVLFFQTAANLLGQTVIKLFGPKHLIIEFARYLLWLRSTVKNS
jgi:hypothetical protein